MEQIMEHNMENEDIKRVIYSFWIPRASVLYERPFHTIKY